MSVQQAAAATTTQLRTRQVGHMAVWLSIGAAASRRHAG